MRIIEPVSKLRTLELLERYFGLSYARRTLCRLLPQLIDHKNNIEEAAYHTARAHFDQSFALVLYDVTTLYFEIDDEDDLRKTGFSKEGKHQNPQIVLGLLVSVDGYPLAYEIFEGNKFEGHTMLPVIEAFKIKYNLGNLVIIADSGLLSNDNIQDLQQKGYDFILGARIKAESRIVKKKILSLQLRHGESKIISKSDKARLIISYSDSRAKKDKTNREKGLRKLEKQIKSGRLTKANINNRGYNKYLKLEGELNISIDKEKLAQDAKWDGLKGYLTNTTLTKEEIIENYGHLWKIEKAFRISKHDLRIRPIYHRLHRRIEAHICIAFVSYKVYKELERQLQVKKSTLSPEKAIEIAKTIYSIRVKTPANNEIVSKTILLTQEQKTLANLFSL